MRLSFISLFTLALGVSCTPNGVEGSTCSTTASAALPKQDTQDAYYRTTVEGFISEVTPEASLTLSTTDGAQVEGSTAFNNGRIIFTPTTPLALQTDYRASITHSCGDASWTFKTSDVGTETSKAVDQKAYSLNLADAHVRVSNLTFLGLVDADLMIQITTLDDGSIQIMGAKTNPTNTQDLCTPSFFMPSGSFNNPYFELGPADNVLPIGGENVILHDLFISGAFAPDAASIEGLFLSAILDTRSTASLLTPNDLNGICSTASGFGHICEACPGDGEPYCLPIQFDQLRATEINETLETLHTSSVTNPSPNSKDLCVEHADVCGDLPICTP